MIEDGSSVIGDKYLEYLSIIRNVALHYMNLILGGCELSKQKEGTYFNILDLNQTLHVFTVVSDPTQWPGALSPV